MREGRRWRHRSKHRPEHLEQPLLVLRGPLGAWLLQAASETVHFVYVDGRAEEWVGNNKKERVVE